MATGSKGTSGKKSPTGTYASAIIFFLILIFVTRARSFGAVLTLVLIPMIVMWVIQGRKTKHIENDRRREPTSGEDSSAIPSPDPMGTKKVVRRGLRSSVNEPAELSDSPDKSVFDGSFAALTGALPGSVNKPNTGIESAHHQQHHSIPAPEYAPHLSPQPPDSVGLDGSSGITATNTEPLIKPVIHGAAFTPQAETEQSPILASAVTEETTSTHPPAEIAGSGRLASTQNGSAAISMTRESATASLHKILESGGSCLSTSSLFTQP
ncbi:hypothetical protein FYJ43_00630 [Cutibacterium sp. WCA-380-WT-3A]|uniref:Uncharacterized protein n=1 Tax=Cutibacterium porci TaxID=2605781 RepID=A0A7K0J3V1_9ACTN|nr:hypothetical protein [Cutibacterium porci]MSS44594.1 hypothetical protein [Cutibacterium porci]